MTTRGHEADTVLRLVQHRPQTSLNPVDGSKGPAYQSVCAALNAACQARRCGQFRDVLQFEFPCQVPDLGLTDPCVNVRMTEALSKRS